MKKLSRLGLLCLLLSVFLTNDTITAQQVILINGEPTEVVLDGRQIQSIVSHQLKNYMEAYGQETEDNFVKALLKIDIPQKTKQKEMAILSSTTKRKKSFSEVTEDAIVMAQIPQ